jgi:hypothetical protein
VDWGSIGGMVADQYRYLDKFAQQIADGKLSEGGPGSGWFAPPKGTHGPGSQGGDPEKTKARKRKLYALNAAARPEVKKGIADCAKSGYKYGIESAVCVAENGMKIDGTVDGNEQSCYVGGFAIAGDRVHTLIHNHPRATSFSVGDVGLMVNWPEMEHSVLVSKDGSLYRLSRTADTIAPLDTYAGLWLDLQKVADPIHAKYEAMMERQELSPNEAWRLATQEAAQEMAIYCGLEYEHIPPKPWKLGG